MDDAGWNNTSNYIPHAPELTSYDSDWAYGEMFHIGVTFAASPCLPPYEPLTPPSSDKHPSPTPPGLSYRHIDIHPITNAGRALVSFSTAFHPESRLLPISPDIILLTTDGILFYIHTTKLLSKSTNGFNQLLSPKHPVEAFTSVPEHSSILNIVLHTIYDLSCAHYHLNLDILAAAVDAMAKYGISPKEHIVPSKPLFSLILNQAPIKSVHVGRAVTYLVAPPKQDVQMQVSTRVSAASDPQSRRLGWVDGGEVEGGEASSMPRGGLDAGRRVVAGIWAPSSPRDRSG